MPEEMERLVVMINEAIDSHAEEKFIRSLEKRLSVLTEKYMNEARERASAPDPGQGRDNA